RVAPGNVVGISIHTGNALRGYEVGRLARARGAYVVFGGIHATLYPDEAQTFGGAHSVVRGDGDVMWASVLDACAAGAPRAIYEAGRVDGASFKPGRWDLLPKGRYMWASVQTVRADGATLAAAGRHGLLHADHDGSGRRSGLPRRDGQGAHPRRTRGRRVGHAGRAQGRLQGLQLRR